MIDIHTHILPGVDDGAQTLQDAIKMIEYAYSKGTTELLLTPHGNWDAYENYDEELLKTRFGQLQEAVAIREIPVKLYLGMEVYATRDLLYRLKRKQLLPVNQTRYMLVEFGFDVDGNEMFEALRNIEQAGFLPIVAHAERYDFVNYMPDVVYEWNRRGYGVQVNAGSLFGDFGRREQRCAECLLTHNLVHFVASDCHNMHHRKPGLADAYQFIRERYSDGYAELLMKINPDRLLKGEKILIVNPRSPKR